MYVQSQVVVTLRLFIGVSTGRATLTQPEIAGGEAIVEKLGEDSHYSADRGGRSFIVRERRYAIFPQQAGTLTVGPATFEAMVIPDRGFSRVSRFRSSTLELAVQPAVPPPAVARERRMAACAAHRAQREVERRFGQSHRRDSAHAPGHDRGGRVARDATAGARAAAAAGIRQYADQPELSHDVTPEGFKSKRAVSMAVIAQTPGSITLPKLELPWWNVKTQAWEIASLPERTFTVAPSAESCRGCAAAESAPAVAQAAAPRSTFWPIASAVLAIGWLATALALVALGRDAHRAQTPGHARRGAHGRKAAAERTQATRDVPRPAQQRRGRCAARTARVGGGALRPRPRVASAHSRRSCPSPPRMRSSLSRRTSMAPRPAAGMAAPSLPRSPSSTRRAARQTTGKEEPLLPLYR